MDGLLPAGPAGGHTATTAASKTAGRGTCTVLVLNLIRGRRVANFTSYCCCRSVYDIEHVVSGKVTTNVAPHDMLMLYYSNAPAMPAVADELTARNTPRSCAHMHAPKTKRDMTPLTWGVVYGVGEATPCGLCSAIHHNSNTVASGCYCCSGDTCDLQVAIRCQL